MEWPAEQKHAQKQKGHAAYDLGGGHRQVRRNRRRSGQFVFTFRPNEAVEKVLAGLSCGISGVACPLSQPVGLNSLILSQKKLFTAKDAKDAKENKVQALSSRAPIW